MKTTLIALALTIAMQTQAIELEGDYLGASYPSALVEEEATGTTAACSSPGCIEVPRGFGFCTHPAASQNWAVSNSACTEIWGIHDGGRDRVQDRFANIRVTVQVPPHPTTARVSVLINRTYAKMTVGIKIYKITTGSLFGEFVDSKVYHIQPTNSMNATYPEETKYKYCLAEDCGVRWSSTQAQFLDMQDWVRSANDREIMAIVTVHNWFGYTNNGLYLTTQPHVEFEYKFNAPLLPGGCEVGPRSAPAYLTLFPLSLLILIRYRRVAITLLILITPTHASMNMVTTNPGVAHVLKSLISAEPNALSNFMNTVMSVEGTAAGSMGEGSFVVQGTKITTPDGDFCTFPNVTLAATNIVNGPEQAMRMPLSFVTDDNCRVTSSFIGNEDSLDMAEEPTDSIHLVTMQGGSPAGLQNQSCIRPFTCSWGHYNRSPLMFPTSPFLDWNVPWPGDLIGVEMPEWWKRYLRTPQTYVAVGGGTLDLGSHFAFPDQPWQRIEGATWLSWTDVPNSGGVPQLRYTVNADRYEVISQVKFRMDGNFYSSFSFDPPAGYEHEFFIAVVMFPEGKMNIVVDFSGTFPLFPFAMEGIVPRLPYLPLTSFRCAYEVSGPDCPWSRPYPMQFACTPPQFEGFSPQCRHYTNY